MSLFPSVSNTSFSKRASFSDYQINDLSFRCKTLGRTPKYWKRSVRGSTEIELI